MKSLCCNSSIEVGGLDGDPTYYYCSSCKKECALPNKTNMDIRNVISDIVLDYAKEGENAGDLAKTVDTILALVQKEIEKSIPKHIHTTNPFTGETEEYGVGFNSALDEVCSTLQLSGLLPMEEI